MLISKTARWFRPYGITVNDKSYFLDNIHFYENDSVIVSTGSGWLQKSEYSDIDEIELPIDEIKLKRKVKFDGTVFVILNRENYSRETRAELYIPTELLGVHFAEKKN